MDDENVIEVNRQLDQLLELNKWYGFNHTTCPVLTADQLTPGKSSSLLVIVAMGVLRRISGFNPPPLKEFVPVLKS